MKYIWLFGENLGKTANNNSFYFWKYIVNRHNDLDAYFIMLKNPANEEIFSTFNEEEKSHVIWRNSIEHIQKYFMADMLFVTLSFRDVQPDKIGFKNYQPDPTQPLVYLQHGTSGIKQLGYGPDYANNSLFRFIYYNPKINVDLTKTNNFKEYQLYNGIYHPRHMEMVNRFNEFTANRKNNSKNFLWFITWREYFGDNVATSRFLKNIKRVVTNKELLNYLDETGNKIKLCLHSLFKESQVEIIKKELDGVSSVEILDASKIDVMQEIVENDVLITDYSSIAFDFTVLDKPVILYQPDREEYLKNRKLYCTLEELEQASVNGRTELIKCIINAEYSVNHFFKERTTEENDLVGLSEGKYIERMYQYFWEVQKNSIVFLGYDFTGIGGTVFATLALVEGLLEKGYLVRLFTLKRMKKGDLPPGVPIHPMYANYRRKLFDKIKIILYLNKKNYYHLENDPSKDALRPIAGHGMKFWMRNIHANTVISTRESLHFFLNEASSDFIRNKVYFFHTAASLVGELFPGFFNKIKDINIENAVFVTDENRKGLESKGFDNYGNYCVLGNALSSTRSLARDEISYVRTGDKLNIVYLLRISKERQEEINRVIEFGEYLKSNNINNIVLSVYGNGDNLDNFLDQIDENELSKYIHYAGATNNIKSTISKYDAVVDFSKNQSFGMAYIEGILNGKMVFAYHNTGSDEVLKEIPECYFESFEELVDKINNLPLLPSEKIEEYYDLIAAKYSRSAVTDKFINFIK